MKAKLLKNIKLQYDIRYLKDQVLLINHKHNEIEEFDTIKDAVDHLIYTFCGVETHQNYTKRVRFRKNLSKYHKLTQNGNSNSKGTKRNGTNPQMVAK
jgi:hypothetical protein